MSVRELIIIFCKAFNKRKKFGSQIIYSKSTGADREIISEIESHGYKCNIDYFKFEKKPW